MAVVSRKDKSNVWWLSSKLNDRAQARLFCFPYAGGSATIFRSWHVRLPDAIEVHAAQLPGRATRIVELPIRSFRDLIPELSRSLLPLLDLPFFFFGHSLGALLSFEVARWLRRERGLIPRHLYVSGRRAPQIPNNDQPIHTKSDDEFLANIIRLKGTPPEVVADTAMLELMLPTLRADFQLAETYEYVAETALTCPITAFTGIDDDESLYGRPEAWRVQTRSQFSCHWLPGGHFFIHSSEYELLELLRLGLLRILSK